MKSPRSKRITRLMAFGPALVVICVTAYAASGVSLVGSATGASTVGVTGTVSTSFSTDPTTTTGGGPTACDDESVGSFASAFVASNGCTLTWSSNNGTGSEIVFENDNAGAVDFFCGDPDGAGALPRDCTTNSNTVDDLVGTGNTLATEGFGLALVSTGGDAGTTNGAGVSAAFGSVPAATDAVWAGIPDQGSSVRMCSIPGPNATNSNCNFVFGALGKGGVQGAGDYSGTLRVTAALT